MAQISDDVVKIGVLTDLSGPASDATGQGSVTAAEMAIIDFGGTVAGEPDPARLRQPPAKIGAAIARYDSEQVDLIILDVPVSAVGIVVQEVSRQKQKLLIVHSIGTGPA